METKTTKTPAKPVEVKTTAVYENFTNYVGFVAKCVKDKLMTTDRDNLRKVYKDAVNVKSPKNIVNVSRRIVRPELKAEFMAALKANGITEAQYMEADKVLVAKIAGKKSALITTIPQ